MRVETYDRLDDAARALAGSRTARFLAGGTLVMRAVNAGDQSFDTIVLSRDASLRAIRPEGDGLTLGAGVTMAEISVHRDLAFLAPVARVVGGPAVRTMATVGGNLFAANPYGDLAVALLALGATVTLAGSGTRAIPIDDFLRDRDRHAATLVASVTIPRPRDPAAFRFAKITRVKPKGVALLAIAANLPASAGRLRGVRIAYGGMAPRPTRAQAVERALEGQALDAHAIEAAARAAADGFDPPTDSLASSWYRREVIGVHLRRLLEFEMTMAKKPLQFRLNGAEKAVFTEDGQNLLDVLRRGVGDLTPKFGCGQGTCGTCTVLVDGQPQLSCLTLAETVEGRAVTTTAGLASGPALHPLQQAFMDNFAAQCGYCTPGMLMAAKALLDREPSPTREQVVEAISGNICRCTGYEPIITAILAAAQAANRRTG